jgi:endonuclease/exonuclease/phosphatase (EEP) superfamily protein YafD
LSAGSPSAAAMRVLKAFVVLLLAPVLALIGAQQLHSEGPPWLELTRYLPFPLLVAPAVVALLLSLRLGWRWLVAALATIGLFVTVAMDLAWHFDVAAAAPADVRVMTYNVKAGNALARPGGVEALAQEIARHRPDVVAMQDAIRRIRGRCSACPRCARKAST